MSKDKINLVYFGRITESKNIDLIIGVLSVLFENGFNVYLDLIGGYTEHYKLKLDLCAENLRVPNERIRYHGANSLDYIFSILRFSHYFIFPSQEKKEGHSNSLTEAMANGVVPIVSTAGFNKSICGDDALVVNEMSAESFAEKIIEIEKSGRWKYFSKYVYNRVLENYTEKQAADAIKESIDSLGLTVE